MNFSLKKDNAIESSIFLLYLLFFISLAFSLRAISSISIGLLLIAGLIKHKGSFSTILKENKTKVLFWGCILFFLLQLLPLFSGSITIETSKDILLKSSLVAIPLAVSLSGSFNQKTFSKFILGYCLIICLAALYSLLIAFLNYLHNSNSSAFFYHDLAKPVQQHAVYFSIFVFIAIVFILEAFRKKENGFPTSVQIVIAAFLSFFLVLLSSKLVITFYVLYLIWFIITQARSHVLKKKIIFGLSALFVILISILLFTRNPVADRFRDLGTGNITLLKNDRFTPGDYFNGLQFRLLQWKFVPSILNESNAWLTGVGSKNAQPLLDKQYIDRNMYSGDPLKGERGYPGYNTHNQFLESLLKNGIPGAIIFLLIIFGLLKLAWQKRHSNHLFIFILLTAYSCVESVFETQYAITLFTFFPFFLSLEE